jgi:putative protein kinase ArgK-like GTPase of G3E family
MNGDDISERSNRHNLNEREDLRRAARIGPTPMSETRAALDAEQMRRQAAGAAWEDAFLYATPAERADTTLARTGDRLIRALRAKGYDVVKIEGDR